jgi:hypothetical protein
MVVILIGIGIILVYSSLTGTMPKDVVLKALGKGK